MRAYDLVVFDLDGTLADTKQDLVDAINHTLAEMGLAPHATEKVASFVGGGMMLLLRRALGIDHDDPVAVERAASIFIPWYREHMLDATRPYPGTSEMLDRIAASGASMAIATNKPRVFTEGIVEALFSGRFNPVVACGDDAPRKPDPQCVTICRAARPAEPGRVLFVGDSVVDVETARAAGVRIAACSWGFGERELLAEHDPDYLVDVMSDIADAVEGKPGATGARKGQK